MGRGFRPEHQHRRAAIAIAGRTVVEADLQLRRSSNPMITTAVYPAPSAGCSFKAGLL